MEQNGRLMRRRRPIVFGLIGGIPFFWRFGPKPKPEKPRPRAGQMDMTNSGLKNARKNPRS